MNPTMPQTAAQNPLLDYIRNTEIRRLIFRVDQELQKQTRPMLAILSEFPGEGKSFFTGVLALGFAVFLGKRVLIVDTATQTQGPALFLERVFSENVPGAPGNVDLISPCKEGDLDAARADFQIGQLIEKCRDRYDLILFDTCALSASGKQTIDPVILSKYAENSLLVLSQKGLGADSLARLKRDLAAWHVNLVGTVFNSGQSQ